MTKSEKSENFENSGMTKYEYIDNVRQNLFKYINSHGTSVRAIAEAAQLPIPTLSSILYGKVSDCRLNTLIALAKALNLSIDELVGLGTMPPIVYESVNICKELPEHARYAIVWYIKHQQAVHNMQPKGSHIVSVMHPRINNNGNLKISGLYSTIDISGMDKEVCRKVFWGIQLEVGFYMPYYSPYDILLIANDRNPTIAENSVILLDDNIFIAKRQVEDGIVKFYSIRDKKFRVLESECQEVIGYIAAVAKSGEFVEEGRI